MDRSVYTPGAGHSPPVLAGRDGLLQDWHLILNDAAVVGRVRAQDIILAGPRGIGKTVTVTAYGELAKAQGFEVVSLQAVAGQAGLVEALLQRAAVRIEEEAGPWKRAKQAFDRVAGVDLGVAGISAGISTRARSDPNQIPDAGSLAQALATLATEVRRDAHNGGLLVTVDELQVASAGDLALLAATLHRLNVDYPKAAVLFAGTGLPFTPEALRKAGVTHPDRLFVLENLPLTLTLDDATYAVVEPARQVGITWHPDAARAVVTASNGYPAHLQLFAHAAWRAAEGPDWITLADVETAIPKAAEQIERRTLGPRWERMADRQMEFMAALAVNGGRATSRDLAVTLGRSQQELSWVRQALIEEGDVYAPKRGHLSLAVPLFGPYVLANYEHARTDASTDLLSLADMRRNLGLPPQDDPHPLPQRRASAKELPGRPQPPDGPRP